MTDCPYLWSWRSRTLNYPGVRARAPWFGDGVDRAGMRCRVVARGSMNSALVEFADGFRVVTSRGGLRKAERSLSRGGSAVPADPGAPCAMESHRG